MPKASYADLIPEPFRRDPRKAQRRDAGDGTSEDCRSAEKFFVAH
jgi:hypothetical protein